MGGVIPSEREFTNIMKEKGRKVTGYLYNFFQKLGEGKPRLAFV